MFNKFIYFIQQSAAAKFFIVGLILAILQAIAGHLSIFSWGAVFLSLLPVLVGLAVLKDKLTYDQKQQITDNSLLFSAIAWSIFMWESLPGDLFAYTMVFVVLTASALLFFETLKQKLVILIPVLCTYVVLLVFVLNPSATIMALYVAGFSIILLLLNYKKEQSQKKTETKEKISGSEKMDMIAQIDGFKTKNQELREDIKHIEFKLSAAEMAKMEFLATMSHEIRTPLNGIIPLLDILLDSELSDFQKDYLSTAHVSAIQMQKLIDDLLDYSKVEAGKLSVETRGLKIPRIMSAVNSSYQQAAQKKNIIIEVDVHKNVSPLLRGDPTRLRQVLSNLLSNAIKFSNRGTIRLVAKKIKDSPTKEVVRFEVIDQGMGLDKETSDSIFLPFTQEDASSTRKFGGTGLGLAISKKIVELMHGTIAVKSEKNKGSNFYFDLPLLKSVGETSVGIAETAGYQAILVNTNPLLFNKIAKKLKTEEVPFQKALGLSQAYDIYASIKKVSKQTKNVLIFVDFETAGKQVRSLCSDVANDKSMGNLFACILTENHNIAGVPQLPNIKLMSKEDSIPDFLNNIEVMQASLDASITGEIVFQSDEDNQEEETNSESQTHSTTLLPNILLVEDNEVNLKVAEKLIQYIGYPFDFALNGQEAFEKVKINRYRMILMDCQMPVMDGYKCTSKIRDFEAAAGLNRTPILAMTANAMMGDREKCLDAGMDDYMSKPLNRYILEKTLKKWDPLVKAPESEAEEKETPSKDINTLETTKSTGAQAPPPIASSTSNDAPKIIQATAVEAEVKPAVIINQKWLSTKSLEDIKEFMGDEIVQLLEMFEQETPTILKKMNTALKSKNFGEIEKMAHMLKSTSANIGANGLSFFSRKMEIGAGKKELAALVVIYDKVKKSYILTRKEIAKYIGMQ